MDKIVEIFLSKELLTDSKIKQILSLLFNVVAAAWLYKLIFGEYILIDLTNLTAIAKFFIDGSVILVIISYGLSWITTQILSSVISKIYNSILKSQRQQLQTKNINTNDIRIAIWEYDIAKNFLLSLRLIKVGKNKVFLSGVFKSMLIEWFSPVQKCGYNIADIGKVFIQFYITFFIANSKFHLPFVLIISMCVLFVIVLLFFYQLMRIVAVLEILMPSYLRNIQKEKP